MPPFPDGLGSGNYSFQCSNKSLRNADCLLKTAVARNAQPCLPDMRRETRYAGDIASDTGNATRLDDAHNRRKHHGKTITLTNSEELNVKSVKVNAHPKVNACKLWAFTLSANPRAVEPAGLRRSAAGTCLPTASLSTHSPHARRMPISDFATSDC